MATTHTISALWRRVRHHLYRALSLAFICSFLLPFVDVEGCTTKKIGTYHGYDLVRDAPVLYLVAIGAVLLVLVLSILVKEGSASFNAFAAAWRAMTAAAAGMIVLLFPGLQFLFDTVFMRIGQFLALLSAGLLFVGGAAEAAVVYVVLRRGRPAGQQPPSGLMKYHAAMIVLALALVPVYGIALKEEVGLTATWFVILTLPFILSQLIVIEGVKRGEAWVRRWAPAVALVMAAAAAVSVAGYF
jgi:hypothetical protein